MSKPLVLENVRLVDVAADTPAVLTEQTVICEDGKIAWRGPAGRAPIPADAEKIDCTGLTMIPGLIEGHSHIGGVNAVNVLRKSLQRGITTCCSVSANLYGIDLRNAIEKGLVRGCASLVAGCIVCPTHGHVEFRTADGPWEVRKAVREMVKAGADFIKTAASGGFWAADEVCSVRNYTLEELVALADEAHAWHIPCVVHAHTQPGINNSIEAGVDQIHHGAFIDEAGVRGILAKNLWYMPTLRVTSDRNIIAWPDRPWMAKEMKESQPIHRAGLKLAIKLGVKICVGTDYPGSAVGWINPPNRLGDSHLFELQEMAKCGMTPLQLIRAATRTNAEAYRIYDRVGSIDAGKMADLVLTKVDPTADIANLYDHRNITLVVKAGKVQYAADEFTKFYRISDFDY